jgi:putative zinc finger/helix-turn-helix YgiT family protein
MNRPSHRELIGKIRQAADSEALMEKLGCPLGHTKADAKTVEKEVRFRDVDLKVCVEMHVCRECGYEFATVEQTAAMQRAVADAYRQSKGLLTGEQIRLKRKKLGLSQKDLAGRMNVGIASIKRWEGGLIQSRSMNTALDRALMGDAVGNIMTGNRALSLARVKLVMKELETLLEIPFLEDGDMLLFDGKYSYYADMLAYNELGKSLTGATYAALPHGPQLNNYKELVDLIRDADETQADPLTPEERRIIARIARTFPDKKMAFDATHREDVWKKKKNGDLMPYSDAGLLKEI